MPRANCESGDFLIELIVLAYTRSLIFHLSLPLLNKPYIKFMVPSSKDLQLIKIIFVVLEINLNYHKLVPDPRPD
jgi:hypothetical protein